MTEHIRGGRRPGAGGTVSTIKISKQHAKTLRLLLKARPSGAYSEEEARRWVEDQIDVAWAEYDAEIQRIAADEWNGEIL